MSDEVPLVISTRSTEFINRTRKTASDLEASYWVLDLIVEPAEHCLALNNDGVSDLSPLYVRGLECQGLDFLRSCIDLVKHGRRAAIIRFLFSHTRGHLTRSDFLVQRLECCQGIERVESFISPLEAIPNIEFQHTSLDQVPGVLHHAIGGLLAQGFQAADLGSEFLRLDSEFDNRFSFPWLQRNPVQRRRIVWVQGRENIGVSQRAYEAARALGVAVVIIDNPGHWLEDDFGPYAHFREAFIPISIEVDQGFTERIVNAIRGYKYPVDGLMTISDVRLPGVAKACEILGLPTSPYAAYQNAGDKSKTRMLEADADNSVVLSSPAELLSLFRSQKGQQLVYPMIIKPALGWNSDCVSRVSNRDELVAAVHRASERHAGAANPSVKVVIEPYIEGPEVDANFVLLEGEVVFFEIEDDFPTRGDAADAGSNDNFQETQVVLPSKLPEDELQLLRDSILRSILRQGFTSGVFHCEARIRNSTMLYTDQCGIRDMEKRERASFEDKSVYLHEINARPPGYLESVAAKLTYGVDYYALRILLCIGTVENSRVLALSEPFLRGPQLHLCILIVPQSQAGVMKTEDAGADLLRRHPELRQHVPDYDTYLKRGDVLEGPSARSLWWVANFSVVSRTSRRECLHWAYFIQQNLIYELE